MKAATFNPANYEVAGGISIHAAREGGEHKVETPAIHNRISIHAAREGGDGELVKGMYSAVISIHAAREGGDRK